MKPEITKECKSCGKEFKTTDGIRAYCQDPCTNRNPKTKAQMWLERKPRDPQWKVAKKFSTRYKD